MVGRVGSGLGLQGSVNRPGFVAKLSPKPDAQMNTERQFSTESELTVLKALNGKDTTYTDARTPGLRVRISAKTGRKTFIFEYRRSSTDNPTKRKLDGVETLKEARKKVAEIKRALEAGDDPFAPPPPPLPPAPEPVKITVSYIAERYRTIKKPSAQDWRLIERRILPVFGATEAADVKTLDISEWHSGITKKVAIKDETGKTVEHKHVPAPHQADRLLDIFRAMMNWAERQELKGRHTNPCEYVQRNFSVLDTERHYDWNDAELERLAEVLHRYEREAEAAQGNGHYMVSHRGPDGLIVEHMPGLWSILALRFLIITGVRKNEALKLRWDQIKEDRNVIEWVRNSRRRETKVIGGGQRAMVRVITGPLGDLLTKLKWLRLVESPFRLCPPDRDVALEKADRRCLDEGIDVPACGTAYILASSRDPRQFVQRRGRILRRSPGKDVATIHDYIVTLPLEYEEASDYARRLIKSELIRVAEFSSLSLNRAESYEALAPILRQFDLEHLV